MEPFWKSETDYSQFDSRQSRPGHLPPFVVVSIKKMAASSLQHTINTLKSEAWTETERTRISRYKPWSNQLKNTGVLPLFGLRSVMETEQHLLLSSAVTCCNSRVCCLRSGDETGQACCLSFAVTCCHTTRVCLGFVDVVFFSSTETCYCSLFSF